MPTTDNEKPQLTPIDVLPKGAARVADLKGNYRHRYTTGPFSLPQHPGSLDWVVLNNDTTPQEIRVTVFKCPIGGPKSPMPPGPLVLTVPPNEATHNANTYPEGFIYEVQVECNSTRVFPYVSVWPSNFGVIIPGTGISSGVFLSEMP